MGRGGGSSATRRRENAERRKEEGALALGDGEEDRCKKGCVKKRSLRGQRGSEQGD